MLRLRKILLCKYPFYLFFIFSLLVCFIRICFFPLKSHYEQKDHLFFGTIITYFISDDQISLDIKTVNNEILKGYYFFRDQKEQETFLKTYHLGDKIKVEGVLSKVEGGRVPNIFNYQLYLERKGIFYLLTIDSIEKIEENKNIIYMLKNWVRNQANKSVKSSSYLKAFILGDKNDISKEAKKSYQENGISHLLALSGMHVGILTSILLFILKKFHITEIKRYFFVFLFLLIYLSIIEFSPSILRAVLFFIFLSVNKIWYFYIKPISILLFVAGICLFINCYYIYDIGFLFSFIISFYLLLFQTFIKERKHYLTKLLSISMISFVASLPILLFNFYQINFLSIIYNLFFVPFVTFLLFPFSLITFFLPFFDSLLFFIITIFEEMSLFCSQIKCLTFIFIKPHWFLIILYYIIGTMMLYLFSKQFYKTIIIYGIILIIHYFGPNIICPSDLYMIDVGQGDAILLRSNNKTVLIDTGGKMNYFKEERGPKEKSSMAETVLIPFFKSLGIKKIDLLILTHGDYDHMGESIPLLQEFKINKVLFNEGNFNNLEERLKQLLNQKKVDYEIAKQGTYYLLGEYQFLSLNHAFSNENDSSLIFLTEIRNYRLLFMGDASKKSEKDLLQTYELGSVDILKVGHHGSNSSTSSSLLEEITPKVALISAGIDNKFHHPHSEVLNLLEKFQVLTYMTNKMGTIHIDFKKGGTISSMIT